MRQVTTKRYIIAGILTLLIFILGVLLGMVIEGKRISYIENLYQKQQVEFSSTQLQYAYLNALAEDEKSGNGEGSDSCQNVFKKFDFNLKQLGEASDKLQSYAANNRISSEEFQLLKRQYTIELLRYWLFSKQVQDICGEDFVRVLYFFSDDKKCPQCADEQAVLTYLKNKFNQKILIFAIDESLTEEQMVKLLKLQYEIDAYPTLIIEDVKYEGFVSADEMLATICPLYEDYGADCFKYKK